MVTKDKGTFNFISPGIKELLRRKHSIQIISEGVSTSCWKADQIPLLYEGPKEVPAFDPTTPPPFTPKREAVDIIIVGTSSPANLDQVYAHLANQMGIPLVIAEDAFGASNRIEGRPRTIITTNRIAGRFIDQSGRHQGTPWVAVGSPAVADQRVSELLKAEYERLTGGTKLLVLYSGQGLSASADIMRKTGELVMNSPRPVTLVMKHHPKGHPQNVEEAIRDTTALLETARPGTIKNSTFSSDELAKVADYTISCYGTALNIAAANHKTPISVWTQATSDDFVSKNGLPEHPLASVGLVALALPETTSWDELVVRSVSQSVQNDARNELVCEYSPKLFADTVESIT